MPLRGKHRSLGLSPNWLQKWPIPVGKDRNLEIKSTAITARQMVINAINTFISYLQGKNGNRRGLLKQQETNIRQKKKVIAVAHKLWNQVTAQHQKSVMNHGSLLTKPYAVLLSCSWVMSATYAKITEKVTANTPDMEITAKYHLWDQTERMRRSPEIWKKKKTW